MYSHIIHMVILMVTMTLSIPNEIKSRMESFPEINWSEVARQAIKMKLSDLDILERIKSTSELTDKDALQLGRELNKRLAKRYSM
jgi:hypothetical protein